MWAKSFGSWGFGRRCAKLSPNTVARERNINASEQNINWWPRNIIAKERNTKWNEILRGSEITVRSHGILFRVNEILLRGYVPLHFDVVIFSPVFKLFVIPQAPLSQFEIHSKRKAEFSEISLFLTIQGCFILYDPHTFTLAFEHFTEDKVLPI